MAGPVELSVLVLPSFSNKSQRLVQCGNVFSLLEQDLAFLIDEILCLMDLVNLKTTGTSLMSVFIESKQGCKSVHC